MESDKADNSCRSFFGKKIDLAISSFTSVTALPIPVNSLLSPAWTNKFFPTTWIRLRERNQRPNSLFSCHKSAYSIPSDVAKSLYLLRVYFKLPRNTISSWFPNIKVITPPASFASCSNLYINQKMGNTSFPRSKTSPMTITWFLPNFHL